MCNQTRNANFPPKLYTPAESAAILGVSLKTLRKWVDAGLIPHTRLGPAARLIRIRAEDIDHFLRAGMPALPEPKADSQSTNHDYEPADD